MDDYRCVLYWDKQYVIVLLEHPNDLDPIEQKSLGTNIPWLMEQEPGLLFATGATVSGVPKVLRHLTWSEANQLTCGLLDICQM